MLGGGLKTLINLKLTLSSYGGSFTLLKLIPIDWCD